MFRANLAACFLSKAHAELAAGASVAVLLRGFRFPARPISGPEPPQGCVSSPNSGDRLFFSIFYKMRWGFSLLGGLTFFHCFSKAGKGLSERIIANLKQGQFVGGEGVLMGL